MSNWPQLSKSQLVLDCPFWAICDCHSRRHSCILLSSKCRGPESWHPLLSASLHHHKQCQQPESFQSTTRCLTNKMPKTWTSQQFSLVRTLHRSFVCLFLVFVFFWVLASLVCVKFPISSFPDLWRGNYYSALTESICKGPKDWPSLLQNYYCCL